MAAWLCLLTLMLGGLTPSVDARPASSVLSAQSTATRTEIKPVDRFLTVNGLRIHNLTMPGLGHYPDQESPDEFVAIVERFLAESR